MKKKIISRYETASLLTRQYLLEDIQKRKSILKEINKVLNYRGRAKK
ncbi:hypothetical protein HCA15_03675 [Listeria booriae]|nr:hypothetical protein [Listeria booriae]MBC6165736.1 hypothetical protein [Listeria booriae]